jgi:hypothetical protein
MSLDEHPLRYAKITDEIEAVLFRRSLETRLGGYTLEAALEVAELLVGTGKKVPSAAICRMTPHAKDLIARLDRWLAACGEPVGNGRSNPDNDGLYLMQDCRAALDAQERAVQESVYLSAVSGRKNFRDALRAERKRVQQLSAALKPFAKLADACDDLERADDEFISAFHIKGERIVATASDARRARDALTGEQTAAKPTPPLLLDACRVARSCQHNVCICEVDPTDATLPTG